MFQRNDTIKITAHKFFSFLPSLWSEGFSEAYASGQRTKQFNLAWRALNFAGVVSSSTPRRRIRRIKRLVCDFLRQKPAATRHVSYTNGHVPATNCREDLASVATRWARWFHENLWRQWTILNESCLLLIQFPPVCWQTFVWACSFEMCVKLMKILFVNFLATIESPPCQNCGRRWNYFLDPELLKRNLFRILTKAWNVLFFFFSLSEL